MSAVRSRLSAQSGALPGLAGRRWLVNDAVRVGRTLRKVAAQVALIGAVLAVSTAPAMASTPAKGGRDHPHSVPVGDDISYPQCGRPLPTGQAFGIVGVNNGFANASNPCLGAELAGAVHRSTGASSQPKASVYVNTTDPGNSYNGQRIRDWPTSGRTPYGACRTTIEHGSAVGQNSAACAWEYGYQKAAQDVVWLQKYAAEPPAARPEVWWLNVTQEYAAVSGVPTQASDYHWWLDVETGDVWQTATKLNDAVLQGMVHALTLAGVTSLGAYSTTYQWNQITGGTTSAAGSLYALSDWVPGATSLAGAERNCKQPPFTGGRVVVTQWSGGRYDGDYVCRR